MKKLMLFCAVVFTIASCNLNTSDEARKSANPASPGFNSAGSDAEAIAIADQVMEAMGGRKNWDKERYFRWNFFDIRTLWWDKKTGDVRIQMHDSDSTVILVNINSEKGRAFKQDKEVADPEALAGLMKKGKAIWINDSYWLFMPFKLKDSGVTLKYVKEDIAGEVGDADILELTFENVGNTPQNKYQVWVDKKDHLVKMWAYFKQNDMEEPDFTTPWRGYKKYRSLLLGGDRGERQITDIAVFESLDRKLFTDK